MRTKKIYRRGSMLVDSLVGIFVLSLAAVSFASLLPMVRKMHRMSDDQSKANLMANRLIEHLQLLRPADVNAGTLTQLNLIDSGQASSPYSFSNIPLDDGSHYSPATALLDGKGEMTVNSIANGSVQIQVQISWTSPAGQKKSITTGTILGGYR